MVTDRRLLFLLGVLVSLVGMLQLQALWKRQSSEALIDAYQSQIDEHARNVNREERELIHNGTLWVGELHDETELVPENVSDRSTPQKILAATIGFDQERLSARFELHECHAGSPQCSSGGGITVYSGERIICRIAVWILQPLESAQKNLYKVWWEPVTDGLPSTEIGRREVLQRLGGEGERPDRTLFHQLLRAAYTDLAQSRTLLSLESVEKQIVRAVCRAIVRSRTQQGHLRQG